MSDNEFSHRFSSEAKEALGKAERISLSLKEQVDSNHLLLAIATMRGSEAFSILEQLDLTISRLNAVFNLQSKKDNPKAGLASREIIELLKQAFTLAFQHRSKELNTIHLLLAIAQSPQFEAYATLRKSGMDINLLKKMLFTKLDKEQSNQTKSDTQKMSEEEGLFGGKMPFFDFPFPDFDDEENDFSEEQKANAKKSKTPTLDLFSVDLTKKAKNKELDPMIGRESEIKRLMQILNRRKKNNPVLIGEPGVGKTAIVEGLAQKIIGNEVPRTLTKKRILSLDLGLIVAGTKYRGEFEKRIKKVVDEIKENPNIIIFIDELHTVIGAGSAEGSIDAANIIKPALARGELRMVGATTLDEYRKHIEKDAAFERRLQPIMVNEPTALDTIQILKGVKKYYEEFHHIKLDKSAIAAAVEFGQKYIYDRFFPDKAIDLIDEASSAKEIELSNNPKSNRINKLEKRLNKIIADKEAAVNSQNFEQAAQIKEIEEKIKSEIKKLEAENKPAKILGTITRKDIAHIVSDWTGIPISDLSIEEMAKYQNLSSKMKESIIGQDKAIDELIRAIKRSSVGIRSEERPIGSFIFLGPTGVGKTETAKVLAQTLFGTKDALVKIDMSEFMEKHNVSRLLGAPPGYVGYDEGGKLTESIRRKPYSVVLFDEIEKAHPDVYNMLLQVLEDGFLTDAQGRRVSFKNTVIIMTSNIGVKELNNQASIGFKTAEKSGEKKAKFLSEFKSAKKRITQEINEFFPPEFINRLDKIIIFNPLTKKEVKQIVKIGLNELKERLRNKDLELKFDNSSVDYLSKNGFDPKFGARPIRRLITRQIEDKISEKLINGEIKNGAKISILKKAKKLEIKIENKSKKVIA